MADEISIVIADDHPIVRQGLRQAVEAEPGLIVVAEAGDGRVALERIHTHRPQVVILDIDMPEMDGFTVARALSEEEQVPAIIFLTIHHEEDFFTAAMDLGAKGYVLKDSALTDIVSCIKAVAAGRHYASPSLTGYLLSRRQRTASGTQPAGPGDLTPTERRILKLIAEYKTSRQIAQTLFISQRTVETHRTNICQKLDLHGSHALMRFALAHKSEL